MSDDNEVFDTIQDDQAQQTEQTENVQENIEESIEQSGVEQAGEEGNDETESKGKDPWYKRRIDELTRDKHEARRQAERLEKILAQQEQMLQKFAPNQEPEQPKLAPPNPADFAGGQYDPRYMEAMLQYTRVSAVEEAKQAIAQEYETRQRQQAMVAAQAKLETAEAAARAKYADYDAVIEGITSDPRLAQNPVIREALLGMDNGPDIAYTLGRNLDVAYEIAGARNTIEAGMKLAELINRAPRKVGNAPAPIKPINGAAGAPAGSKRNYADMTTAEYIAARNAEDLAKRQAMYKR